MAKTDKRESLSSHEWSASIPISEQSAAALQKLAEYGIYGRTPEEVAARFIDEKIQGFGAEDENQ